MITAKQLIEILQNYPEDTIVIISSDPEGNNLSTVHEDHGTGFWDEKNEEYFNDDDTEDLSEKQKARLVKAVSIWPD